MYQRPFNLVCMKQTDSIVKLVFPLSLKINEDLLHVQLCILAFKSPTAIEQAAEQKAVKK